MSRRDVAVVLSLMSTAAAAMRVDQTAGELSFLTLAESCPNVAGEYTCVETHDDGLAAGEVVTVVQNGCDLVLDCPALARRGTGTVTDAGMATLHETVDGQPKVYVAIVDGDTATIGDDVFTKNPERYMAEKMKQRREASHTNKKQRQQPFDCAVGPKTRNGGGCPDGFFEITFESACEQTESCLDGETYRGSQSNPSFLSGCYLDFDDGIYFNDPATPGSLDSSATRKDRLVCSDILLEPPVGIGDPHITDVAGRHFDVRRPGDHVMLRAPADPNLNAALEVHAEIEEDGPCQAYIKQVTASGALLNQSSVAFRTRRRDVAGSNSAGTTTIQDFAVQVGAGKWTPFSQLVGGNPRRIQLGVGEVEAVNTADAGGDASFQLRIKPLAGRSDVVLTVHQGAHQALDMRIDGASGLAKHLGGLLGSEDHDAEVAKPTEMCLAAMAGSGAARWPSQAMHAHASW